MKFAGLDIGTTGCKLTVFDAEGIQLDKAYQSYPVRRKVDSHTIDARDILEGVYTVIKKMAVLHPEIMGIGVTSFGETCVLTDADGNPLQDAMLYTDPRGKVQREILENKLGSRHIAEISGVKPHEMYSLPKIMWIKDNEPELYEKAKHIFLMEDFIVFALTHNAQIDYSLATRTMGFDIHKLTWSKEIFDAAGIDISLMSKPVPTGTSAGFITSDIVETTKLSPQVQIISISHDQVSAAIGAGVFDSKTAVDGAGTVECLTPVYDSLPNMKTMYDGNYAVVPYVIPGKYVCYAFSYTGGALIQWCVETIAKKEIEEANLRNISVNQLLEESSVSPTNILVLPHFAGAATPYMDCDSKGAIVGLTAANTVADIYRACMEGVVYEMMLNMEYLKSSGISFGMLNATGGGAHSKVWMQMKADVLNIPVTALETVDAGTVGSAMLTGIVVGAFKDLKDAAEHMVKKTVVYKPNLQMHEKYKSVYLRYKKLYEAVRPLV